MSPASSKPSKVSICGSDEGCCIPMTALPQTRNERPAAHQPPLRLCHMKDTNDHNQRNGPGEPQGTPEPTPVSYTPEERNLIRKGLRI